MKLWLVGISGPGSLENLRELIDPVRQYFDGVIWTLHDSRDTEEAAYLESVKGEGRVIHYYYNQRHCESRNQYLWCGPAQDGDWLCQVDDLERLVPSFASRLRLLIAEMRGSGLNCTYYWGKPFLFEHHESLRYVGSPHESLRRESGDMRSTELSGLLPDESQVRQNVRPIKRPDPFHFVGHFLRYWLFPYGSNHAMLGLDHFPGGSTQATFQAREAKRLEFRQEMRRRGYPLTVDGARAMLSGPLDDVLKGHLQSEKVLSDWYHYEIKGRRDVKATHNPADALPID